MAAASTRQQLTAFSSPSPKVSKTSGLFRRFANSLRLSEKTEDESAALLSKLSALVQSFNSLVEERSQL